MRTLTGLFTDHPASVGETYFQHMASALSFGVPLVGAVFAIFVHAFFPFLLTKTGSGIIVRLHDRMVLHRTRVPAASRSTPQW